MDTTITFWGVRGSIPAPGSDTQQVGGNTTCCEVRLGGERILLDAGSGLRAFGASLQGRPFTGSILFSHLHWDHIQGVPFCAPLYHPQSRVTLVGPVGLKAALEKQMSRPNFPVGLDVLGAQLDFYEVEPGRRFEIGVVQVRTVALNHPGGALAYRLEHDGRVLAHALDHEPGDQDADRRLRALCAGADLVVGDAQYTPAEYPGRVGWGHGTFASCAELAAAAGVGTLVLAHHDPLRCDRDVTALEQEARARFAGCVAAREGATLQLGRSLDGAQEEGADTAA